MYSTKDLLVDFEGATNDNTAELLYAKIEKVTRKNSNRSKKSENILLDQK